MIPTLYRDKMRAFSTTLMLFVIIAVASGTRPIPPELLNSVDFYCTRAGKVLALFNENLGSRSLPRIFGTTSTDTCEQRTNDRVVALYCGYHTGRVNLIIDYDDMDKYSLAQVTCPQNGRGNQQNMGVVTERPTYGRLPQQSVGVVIERAENKQLETPPSHQNLEEFFGGAKRGRFPRQNFKVSADKHPSKGLGKANAVMEIGLDYNDLDEIRVTCQPSGIVYVTNPDPSNLKHMFSYNSRGSKCVTLMLHDNIVEISDCDQERIIEISFSEAEFDNNIIGGRGELRVYKFNCTEIGIDPVFFRHILALNGGTSVSVASINSLILMAISAVILKI